MRRSSVLRAVGFLLSLAAASPSMSTVKYYSRQKLGVVTVAAPAAPAGPTCPALVPSHYYSGGSNTDVAQITSLAAAQTRCSADVTKYGAGTCAWSGINQGFWYSPGGVVTTYNNALVYSVACK